MPAGGGPRGHYFFAVKANQPTLLEDITAIWDEELEAAQAVQVDQHGGRVEQRRLWASDLLVGYSDWPHLAQVCRLERIVRRNPPEAETRREIGYAVTSLPRADASPPSWALRISSGVSEGVHHSVVQGGGEFLHIVAGRRQ